MAYVIGIGLALMAGGCFLYKKGKQMMNNGNKSIEVGNIMQTFFLKPNLQDFNIVFKAYRDEIYKYTDSKKSKKKFEVWICSVLNKYPTYLDQKDSTMTFFMNNATSIIDTNTKIGEHTNLVGKELKDMTPEEVNEISNMGAILDNIWSAFFASGDTKYPIIIKNYMDDKTLPESVRFLAEWSYNSIRDQYNLSFEDKLGITSETK